jgi:hypothetical protein
VVVQPTARRSTDLAVQAQVVRRVSETPLHVYLPTVNCAPTEDATQYRPSPDGVLKISLLIFVSVYV